LRAESSPNKAAVLFEGDTISYGELYERVEIAASYFSKRLGSEKQQVVALLATNSIDFIICHLAILHAGHITMPLDPVFKKLEVDAIIERMRPAMLVFQDRYSDKFSAREDIDMIPVQTLLKNEDTANNESYLRFSPHEQVATITFTSGTSGQPKGVPNTHSNHAWNIYACSKVWDWTADDNLLITLPLSHMHGLVIGLSGTIYHGNTMYLHQQSFDTEAVLSELASGKISLFTHGPIAYAKMLEAEGDYDISPVRLLISGSAPLPPSLWREFKHRYGVEIIETYGTSETGRIAGNPPADKRLGTPGRPMPDVNVKFGAGGEIEVKSPGVFPGYWNNPEATAAALTADGYWRTGDIGELKDGYMYLKGRLQERIRKFGYTVSPRDVEWALLENPNIKEAFVMGTHTVGEPDDKIVYFINGDISDSELEAYCKQNLPFSWRPDRIIMIDSLPRTKNGKPYLSRLKEMAAK
jgi:malonyl-CoA/methylmalonyl-CoA synthetase